VHLRQGMGCRWHPQSICFNHSCQNISCIQIHCNCDLHGLTLHYFEIMCSY